MWARCKHFFWKNKRDIAVCAGLFAVSQLLCLLFVWRYGLFGSDLDWISQHSVLPDYFRQRFYDTGSLFPDFAWNLGAGQNIYNLSYYGLFSPVVLFSYLLPFVKMDWYIMITSMLSYGISGVLYYLWIAKRWKKENTCSGLIPACTAMLYLLASPMLYHSYNQLMFVNYMPFLLLAFIGTDRYLEHGKRGLLIAGTFCMILTSYFFSVGGLLALGLYMVGQRMEFRKRVTYVGNLLIGVALAGFLLVPTALALFSGRGQSSAGEAVTRWFVPERFLYSPYGLGLTALIVFVLAGAVIHCRTWERRLQVWGMMALLLVPLAAKLLNGGLYAKDKVFLPFLPLVCMEAALEMRRLKELDWRNKRQLAGIFLQCAVALVFLFFSSQMDNYVNYRTLLLTDGLLLVVSVLCYIRFPRIPYPLLGACGILLLYQGVLHVQVHHMIEPEFYDSMELDECRETVEDVVNKDSGLYRTEILRDGARNLANINRVFDIRQNLSSVYSSGYDGGYYEFRKQTFQLNIPFRNAMMLSASDNPCWLQFMGVRYVIGKQAPVGYEKEEKGKTQDGLSVYANRQASPLCYVTNRVLEEKEYEKLEFPDNQTALMQYAVIGKQDGQSGASTADLSERMASCSVSLPLLEKDNVQIRAIEGGYEVTAGEETTLNLPVQAPAQDDLLAMSMEVENLRPNKDMHVRLNGQTNRLSSSSHEYANGNDSFHFMVTLSESGSVQMKLSRGHYRITNLQAWSGNFDSMRDESLYETGLQCEAGQPSGDSLTGTIEAGEDAWLVTTFPYDAHFQVEIDGTKVKTCRVNTAFLGAKVSRGKHEIVITYRAPGKTVGMLLSIAGLCLLAGGWVVGRRMDMACTLTF